MLLTPNYKNSEAKCSSAPYGGAYKTSHPRCKFGLRVGIFFPV